MQLVLFDDAGRTALYPFTHTRPTADIRCGILTSRERWQHLLEYPTSSTLSEEYLQGVYPAPTASSDSLLVNGQILATPELAKAVKALQPGTTLYSGDTFIAASISGQPPAFDNLHIATGNLSRQTYDGELRQLAHPWDIFSQNDWAIRQDVTLLTSGRTSAPIPEDVTIRGTDIFLEEGAIIGAGSIINTTTGPVYIGKGAEILEGCIIRGPLALGDHAVLKMGAKVYSGTSIGPGCKVGGEISNVVFFANSNKGHDGFLGNAVIGEWCNLGADTNCSNLKNNYDEVKIWSEHTNKSVKTGLTFCGLMMGDHSKCAINTSFNTGTVVGVSSNIFGSGFPEKFVPSFCWGGNEGMTTYDPGRAMETANRMMGRRNKQLSDTEKGIMQ